ncbi:MAG: DUF2149 domain-containing protein [Roseateles sp.]
MRYKGQGGSSEGQGVRAGTAYKLKDGNLIYVPEAQTAPGPAAPATPTTP